MVSPIIITAIAFAALIGIAVLLHCWHASIERSITW